MVRQTIGEVPRSEMDTYGDGLQSNIHFVIVVSNTSNDWSIRRMGPAWKALQPWVYIAAAGTLLHWISVHNQIGPALVHFVPIAGLEAYRLWHNFTRRTQPA